MTDEDKLVKLSLPGIIRLFQLVAPYKWRLILAGVLTLFSSVITLSLPLISQKAIDLVVRTQRVDQLDRMVYVFAGSVLILD